MSDTEKKAYRYYVALSATMNKEMKRIGVKHGFRQSLFNNFIKFCVKLKNVDDVKFCKMMMGDISVEEAAKALAEEEESDE